MWTWNIQDLVSLQGPLPWPPLTSQESSLDGPACLQPSGHMGQVFPGIIHSEVQPCCV